MPYYSILFIAKNPFGVRGCRVLLRAHALSQNGSNGVLIAQCRFENLGNQTVRALCARFDCTDDQNRPLPPVTHRYSGLDAVTYAQFGAKEAVVLPPGTRHYTVTVEKILFADGSQWEGEGFSFAPLEGTSQKTDALPTELREQYQKELEKLYGASRQIAQLPSRHENYLVCACGAYLSANETHCPFCGVDVPKLMAVSDPESLRQLQRQAIKRSAKRKKIALQAAAACTVVFVASIVLGVCIQRANNYTRALDLIDSGQIAAAITVLDDLDTYKDAAQLANYERAILALRDGRESDALSILKRLDTYKDSAELSSALSWYLKGQQAIADGDLETAKACLEQGSYYGPAQLLFDSLNNLAPNLNPDTNADALPAPDSSQEDDPEKQALYEQAMFCLQYGMPDEGFTILQGLGNYKDAEKLCAILPLFAQGKRALAEGNLEEARAYLTLCTYYDDARLLLENLEAIYAYIGQWCGVTQYVFYSDSGELFTSYPVERATLNIYFEPSLTKLNLEALSVQAYDDTFYDKDYSLYTCLGIENVDKGPGTYEIPVLGQITFNGVLAHPYDEPDEIEFYNETSFLFIADDGTLYWYYNDTSPWSSNSQKGAKAIATLTVFHRSTAAP